MLNQMARPELSGKSRSEGSRILVFSLLVIAVVGLTFSQTRYTTREEKLQQ